MGGTISGAGAKSGMKLTERKRPLLLVVSAPSGAGKTTLCHRLLAEFKNMAYSVSCTTRPPRGSELSGRDYRFVSEEEFKAMVGRGEFLEYARVHGYWYGTPRAPVLEALRQGRDVLMDIDVQGARAIRGAARSAPAGDPIHDGYVDVFIAPPSLDELRRRLELRQEDAPETIVARVKQAEEEMGHAGEYTYVVINDDIDRAYDALRAIVIAEHHRIVTV